MRLAIVVTEFPKTTETFILRDLMMFHEHGHEIRIFHVAPFRKAEIVHEFARPCLAWAHSLPMLLHRDVILAFMRMSVRHPVRVLAIIADIVRGTWRQPILLAKSLALLPKSMAFADYVRTWRADHIHAEFAGHPATSAWIVGRLTGIPYSVSCRAHDIFRTQSMLDIKLQEAAFVRTISEYNRRFLLQAVHGLAKERIHIIHSSVDIASMPAHPPPADGPFHILYVGSLQARKGVDVLLRALAGCRELGEWRCDLIGGGPERRALERLAVDLGLGDRVHFLGSQSFETVCRAYADANVVVAPSIVGPGGRTEGIPNVMIEALAYQRPAISTRVSGVPELIRNGESGILCSPGNADELGVALQWVRSHPKEAFDLARRGRQLVEQEFDLRINAKEQLRLFQSHAARAAPPTSGLLA